MQQDAYARYAPSGPNLIAGGIEVSRIAAMVLDADRFAPFLAASDRRNAN
jgi:hypothetical protein